MDETDTTRTELSNDELADAAGPDLSKLTKAQLIEQLADERARADKLGTRLVQMEDARDRRRASPENAFVITALVELHRETASAMPGVSTIRGRAVATTAPRYLEAARVLGDDLVESILGPSKPEAKPAR